MTRSLGTLKRTALALMLALIGLALSLHAVPATHAYWLPTPAPTITATVTTPSPYAQYLSISGAHFSSGGTVWVTVYNNTWGYSTSSAVTASLPACNPVTGTCSMGGSISLTVPLECAANELLSVQAYDVSTNRYSNVVSLYVPPGGPCIP